MARLVSRRKVIAAAGGAAALAPLAAGTARATPPVGVSGTLVTLLTPIRLYDSRVDPIPLNGAKLASGESIGIIVHAFPNTDVIAAAFLNLTVTETEGAGFLRATASDATGERPPAPTSNVNWYGDGQTLANLALTQVGFESTVELHAGGTGRTHVVVDLFGYVPAPIG
jgi:hypothetical protein